MGTIIKTFTITLGVLAYATILASIYLFITTYIL